MAERPDGGLAAHVDQALRAGLLAPYDRGILSPAVKERMAECTAKGAKGKAACTSAERLEKISALWADVLGM